MKSSRLRFGSHELHLDRGCLLLHGNEVVVRPKTFKVLQHLVENPGRLVSKEELFAAVWPNLVVTDDTLVQSIGELRRALGDDGPTLIRTIPRRGYRFDSVVSVITPVGSTFADAAPSSVASPQHQPPQTPASIARTYEEPVPEMHRGRRTRLFALPTAVALFALAVLWGGLATDWTFSRDGSGLAKSRDPGVRIAIAVLPFVNMSEDSGREYFSDGLTQDVINALGRFSDLTVMSWNAVYPYKGQPASPSEVTRRLAVHYQVEGSVIREDERVRVVAQLVSPDGRVLWSARFDEPLADLFVLRDRIATEVAGALAIRVTRIEQKRILQEPTETLEAYDYILRARHALQRPTRANNIEARALLRRAIQADPGFAAAHAELAENYHVAASMGWTESPTEALSTAEELATKALSLDEAQVRAHLVLGRIHI